MMKSDDGMKSNDEELDSSRVGTPFLQARGRRKFGNTQCMTLMTRRKAW